MTQDKLDHIETLCTKALDEAKAQGMKIVDDHYWAPEDELCCLIGALTKEETFGSGRIPLAATILDISENMAQALEDGFCDYLPNDFQDPCYLLGQKLRTLYLNK